MRLFWLNPGLKSMLMEKRVEALSGALELKEAQLGEVLAAAHLDPATLQQVGLQSFTGRLAAG